MKRLTLFSLEQPGALPDFDTAQCFALIVSLGDKVSAKLKLVRCISLEKQTHVFYHRESEVDGTWWMHLPPNEDQEIFAEARTPRVIPVGKWDWEIEAETDEEIEADRILYLTEYERRAFGFHE